MTHATKCDYLVFDVTNLLWRTFAKHSAEKTELATGLALHTALTMMNKYYRKYQPRKLVMAFDGKSWRKDYTASAVCVSQRPYKGNRRQNMTPAEQAKYAQFTAHVAEFQQLITEHTTITSLYDTALEADDCIAGICQYVNGTGSVVIISADSDMLQLTSIPQVKVISPITDKEQSLSDYDNDPVYYLFQKCIRGDSTDNVQSAFPRVRSTRIRKAYDDEFERVQLMKEKWTDENGRELSVESLYNENRILIDLSKQPPYIRQIIEEVVDTSMESTKKFSYMQFLKYLGKHELVDIKNNADQYLPMLSS